MKLNTDKGRIIAQVSPEVTVRYDRQFNMIEVLEKNKVIICGITPPKYTLNQFYDYMLKVQQVYSSKN